LKKSKLETPELIGEGVDAVLRSSVEADDLSGKVGQRIRMFRELQGWSLTDASKATGIPPATLSRIENSKMSPTFGLLLRLMKGMKVGWLDLVGDGDEMPPEDQVSVYRPGRGETHYLDGSNYIMPHVGSQLSEVLHSVIFEVEAHSPKKKGGLNSHHGVEMCYVISGTLMLHIEGRHPEELPAGCTALFKSSLPHAYLAKPGAPVRILNITVRDPLMSEAAVPFVHARMARD
jgi:transcriptional regulator with XRE-family HTH domain